MKFDSFENVNTCGAALAQQAYNAKITTIANFMFNDLNQVTRVTNKLELIRTQSGHHSLYTIWWNGRNCLRPALRQGQSSSKQRF